MTAEKFAACAREQLGKPYVWATAGPDTFDCSGLVSYCYNQVTGKTISRSSHQQVTEGERVSALDAIAVGDLVFWGTDGTEAGHVGIYQEGGTVVNALNATRGVIESRLDAPMGGPLTQVRRLDLGTGDSVETPTSTVTFGKVKHPAYERHIVPKPWVGAGYDVVPPRQILGLCMHKWWGYGDKLALVRLFGTGGERQGDALTDYSLTQEGELVMLNEPEGTRSPWANGGSDGLEGDGTLFTRKLGVAAINARLISVEFEGKSEPLTAAQLEVGSDLWAHWFDRRKVSWEDYPMNPKVGCVTDLDHYEFATKDCPFAGARGQRSDFQDLVRGKMKAGQVGAAPDPVPPETPVTPDHGWLPDGMSEAMVKGLFGRGVRHNADGSTSSFEFDPTGLISNAWLSRGAKQSLYPAASNWWKMKGDGVIHNLVSFANGWILEGEDGNRATWTWRGA